MSASATRSKASRDTDDMAEAMTLGAGVRIAEALLFASREPLAEAVLVEAMPEGADLKAVLSHLQNHYASRGINLLNIGGKWTFRTATDLGYLMRKEVEEPKKLSRAAMETLAILAYHQPVTRAEIEEIRGVSTSKGTLDVLMETGWIRMRGRRKTPGRPITFGTSEAFLSHFGLSAISDLPGLDELKSAGMFDGHLPSSVQIPLPSDDPALRADEDPLDGDPLLMSAEERINMLDLPLEDGEDTSGEDDSVSENAASEELDPLADERRG
jgi:segregation and condensation protein B